MQPSVITKVLLTRDRTYPTVRTPKVQRLEENWAYPVRADFLVCRQCTRRTESTGFEAF